MTSLRALVLIVVVVAGCGGSESSSPTAPSPPAPSASFTLQGDPESTQGATWTYRGSLQGVTFDLQGILLKPAGTRAVWCGGAQPRRRRQRLGLLPEHRDGNAAMGTRLHRDQLHPRRERADRSARHRERAWSQRRERAARTRGARNPEDARLRRSVSRGGARPQHGRLRDHGPGWRLSERFPRGLSHGGRCAAAERHRCRHRARRRPVRSGRRTSCIMATRMPSSRSRRTSVSTGFCWPARFHTSSTSTPAPITTTSRRARRSWRASEAGTRRIRCSSV